MAKIEWDVEGSRLFETGTDRGVLYVQETDGTYGDGVPWNGLISVNESPEGAEETILYADNMEYGSMTSAEKYKSTIEAYMYPEEFEACEGSKEIVPGVTTGQQTRSKFGYTYRTLIGSDVNADLGYKIHIVYGAKAAPSEKAYSSVNDSPEAITFSWEVTTTPIPMPEPLKPAASITINSTKVSAEKLAALEAVLYGGENTEASLPSPAQIKTLLTA